MKAKLAPIVIAVAVVTGMFSFTVGYVVGRFGQAMAAIPAIPIPGPMSVQQASTTTTQQPVDVGTSIDPVDAGIVAAVGDEPAESEPAETLENYKAVAKTLAAENASLAEEIQIKDRLIETLQMQIEELKDVVENPTLLRR